MTNKSPTPTRRAKSLGPTKPAKSARSKSPYPALANGPSVEERRAQLLGATSRPPMTEEEWNQFLDAGKTLWPNDEEIEAFQTWLKKGRRTGKYS